MPLHRARRGGFAVDQILRCAQDDKILLASAGGYFHFAR
jgi:hypothetical protein